MKKNRLILIDCKEAVRFCDKAQYREATFSERLKMRLHYLICVSCRKYQTSNSRLTKLIEKAGIQTCTKDEKEGYRQKMQAESLRHFKEQ